MTVVTCPVCGAKVNALTLHCPECGADPKLPSEQAQADLRTRGLSLPGPRVKRAWIRRRRLLVLTLAVFTALVLLAPLWLGYFGPATAVYASTWRPWRQHLTVHIDRTFSESPNRATGEAEYSDPWPGTGRSPGHQTVFVTVRRLCSLLPWVVTERGTGP